MGYHPSQRGVIHLSVWLVGGWRCRVRVHARVLVAGPDVATQKESEVARHRDSGLPCHRSAKPSGASAWVWYIPKDPALVSGIAGSTEPLADTRGSSPCLSWGGGARCVPCVHDVLPLNDVFVRCGALHTAA